MLGNLIGGFIVILVGTTLIPVVADNIIYASCSNGTSCVTNLSGTSVTILGLTTIFFALGVMSAGVSLAVSGLRNAGLV